MALSNYSDLQSSVASWLHRTDLTTEIQDFIRLAEADLQVRAKLSQWDTSATVSLVSGVAALPSDFAQAIGVTYSGGPYTLSYLPLTQFKNVSADAESGSPAYYTIFGANLAVYPLYTGDLTLDYTAMFTALSNAATTNSLLTLFPDAYLNGALAHAASWTADDAALQKHSALFEQSIQRVRSYMREYKYPHGLQMRVA